MRFYRLIRPLLFLLPPEFAHALSVKALTLEGRLRPMPARDDYILQTKAFGINFPNPFGMAAGFDKNGEAVDGILKIGFGFAEIGTLTPRPQAGNPRPRLFRLVRQEAIINHLGFNNQGHEAAYRRLTRRLTRRVAQRVAQGAPIGILGVNIGANKDSPDPIKDYEAGVARFAELADYVALNISSPNTPNLRDLQAAPALSTLIKKVQKTAPHMPLLLKIAPDLSHAELVDIADIALKTKIAGLIVTNTTVARDKIADSPYANRQGGLSGRPLMDKSTQILATMYYLTQGKLPLIAAGGVSSAADAYAKMRAGASLVQLYTALVYQGPRLVRKLKSDLVELLRRDGVESVMDVTGADVTEQLDKQIDKQTKIQKPRPRATTSKQTAKQARAKQTTSKQTQERKMRVTIYHNPRCSKSRQTLSLLEEQNVSVTIIEYLKTPPTAAEIKSLLKKLQLDARGLMRKGEKIYKELDLQHVKSEAALIKAMVANPILIERPIVVKGRQATIARPPEQVLTIL